MHKGVGLNTVVATRVLAKHTVETRSVVRRAVLPRQRRQRAYALVPAASPKRRAFGRHTCRRCFSQAPKTTRSNAV